jgi:hypothetical protein
MFLSKQSGIGFNPDTELYEAPDYVWDSLNKSHPKIKPMLCLFGT